MWRLSSSSDPIALGIVDGIAGEGPHYSRRTPGSKTFTGVGREVVLVSECRLAVWAVVLQKTPAARGSGASRGREGSEADCQWLWRNNMFRRLPGCGWKASELICSAVQATRTEWLKRYGELPGLRMRTEVDVKKVASANPGYCYMMAGWEKGAVKRGKLHLWEPQQSQRAGFHGAMHDHAARRAPTPPIGDAPRALSAMRSGD